MDNFRKQRGMILPVMIVTMCVMMITVTGLYSYVSSVRRNVEAYSAINHCRLQAQSKLDEISYRLYTQFNAYNVNNPSIPNPLQYFKWSPGSVGDGSYAVAMPSDEDFTDSPKPGKVTVVVHKVTSTGMTTLSPGAWVTLRATASMPTPEGISVSRTIEEVVLIGLNRSTVFNYAYFINNYGWFEGGGVKANGDIRANGNMELDGYSYVNGNAYASYNPLLGAAGSITGSFRHDSRYSYWNSAGLRARPTTPTSSGGAAWAMGYDPDNTAPYQYQDAVSMPFLGDLDLYVNMAKEQGGTIKQGGKTLVNAEYSGAGPSGSLTAADRGCLVLDGTTTPIEINGPVVVDGDVIIKGTVTGQGTIYAGRNIHIVGDVSYADAPSWSKPDETPDATVTANSTADMLGLAAKGNIVIGDSSSSSWHSSCDSYIGATTRNGGQFTHSYACDPTDSSIGYPSTFDGDYTAEDGLEKVSYQKVAYYGWVTNTYSRYGRIYTSIGYGTAYSNALSKTDSHYYDSLIGDDALSKAVGSSSINKIDAVLYNNHAIMGTVGNCVINGSLVSRDEAIIYSGSLKINWDIRLGTQSKDGMDFFIYLPVAPARPQIVSWREI